MRRFFACSLIAFGLMTTSSALPAVGATISAPADEYFGTYHLSILGIRNALSDMTARAQTRTDHGASYLQSAMLAENSIHDWQAKYPKDAWLPKMILSLERLYVTIGTSASAEHAVETAAWLGHSYPSSDVARLGREELARLSTSDDGGVQTADAPAMLGMVPALADTTVPPNGEEGTTMTSPNAVLTP